VVGLGQLGLPVATYVKKRGFDTYGYDISPKAVEMAQKTGPIEKAIQVLSISSPNSNLIGCIMVGLPSNIDSWISS
jgi:UDP-N-acetyl-D-mannosaminuronate dehydrogenase